MTSSLIETSPRVWSLIAAGADVSRGSVLPYDEDPQTGYKWTSRVPNHSQLSVGDLVVVRDKYAVLGVSIIELINSRTSLIFSRKCPSCQRSQFRALSNNDFAYRCTNSNCRHEFNQPVESSELGTEYSSIHASHWIDLSSSISLKELRDCHLKPNTQHSITRVDWNRLLEILDMRIRRPILTELEILAAERLPILEDEQQIKGGYRNVIARSRIGQGKFREKLFEKYGASCFMTGKQPPQALDAAHLYSFADLHTHEDHGGILLRKDLHALFDYKMISINAGEHRIEVIPGLHEFPEYGQLHGRSLHTRPTEKQMMWFDIHHRSFLSQ